MTNETGYPWFKRGLPAFECDKSVQAEDIPTYDRREADDPDAYIPSENLSHAVNTALGLGMPLLLTGEPGTGKTQLAYTVAQELGCPIHKFETKSTSQAKDLFYTYDALTAFKLTDEKNPRRFIQYQALGRAILEAFPQDHPALQELLPINSDGSLQHPGQPRRSVVLIDEIDKAPRDFPNDLLNEIDRLYFRVPELFNAGSPGAEDASEMVESRYRPIIILTSNSEKGLPDPFLRRCVYYDIPFPDAAQMETIVAARMKGLQSSSKLLEDAIDLFFKLRHEGGETRLKKPPSTAELIDWIRALRLRGHGADDSLRDHPELVQQTLSALVKQSSDHPEAEDYFKRWLKKNE